MLSALVAATFSLTWQSPSDLTNFAAGFTKQVSTLKANGGLPGPVLAFGPNAEVLAVAKDGKALRPVVAAATYGKGRVVIVGHGSLLSKGNEAASQVLLKWLAQSSKPIGLFADISITPAFGTPLRFNGAGDIRRATEQCSVLVFGQSPADNNPEALSILDKYVQNGGSLVLGGPAWGWLQLNPGKRLTIDHGGNQLLMKMGLGFADGTIDPERDVVTLVTPEPAHHVMRALAMMRSKRVLLPEEAKLVGETLESAMGGLPADSPISRQLDGMLDADQNQIRPTKEKPLKSDQFQLRLSANYFDRTWRSLPPEKVKAHPTAADFPGLPTSADRIDRLAKIGGKLRRWWSTATYAAPGEVVTVRLPDELKGFGIRLRIGGHNDTLWHLDKWERFPSIALEVPIKDGVAKAANPFGGLIYLVCDKAIPVGTVSLEHVVQAPVYQLGRTQDQVWKEIRNSPAPWGEIVSNYCAISVPASVLRKLDNPKEVAEYWDEVVEQCNLLYSVPAGSREERYQVDRQISAGYMHSGYPIMTWEDVSAKFVDTSILRGKNGDPNWGFYHEIGHNYQRPSWTWNGWGETTNNLYSLFGSEHFNNDLTGSHGAMKPEQREKRMQEVMSAPGKAEYFDKDPWYGLTMLRAIREEFGWSPFQKLFAEFRDLPRGQQPKNEGEKHDQFLVRMSTILKRDLSRYFAAWGVKNSSEAKSKAGEFKDWMPKGF